MRARVYRITQMPDTLEDKSAFCRGEPLRKMADKSPEMRVRPGLQQREYQQVRQIQGSCL